MEDMFVKCPDLIIDDAPEEEFLITVCKNIKSNINKLHTSQVSLCFYLNQIREYFKKNGRLMYKGEEESVFMKVEWSRTSGSYGSYSAKSFVKQAFNISERTYFRLLKVYDTFFINSAFDKRFEDFSITKLIVLSVVPLTTLIKDRGVKFFNISTVKELEAYVKSVNDSGDIDVTSDEETKETEDKPTELPDLDKPCNVSLNIKRENLEYIKGLGVEIDSYINKLIEDDKSNRCTDWFGGNPDYGG